MATAKQVDYIRVLQKQMGSFMSDRPLLRALEVSVAHVWIELCKLGVNPVDLVVPPVDMRPPKRSRATRTPRGSRVPAMDPDMPPERPVVVTYRDDTL